MKVRASRAGDLLANSPDGLKAEPIRENLLASWRQSGQKQDPGPASPNHNATYKPRLSPYYDFANRSPAREARTFMGRKCGARVCRG
jgi:hypothetical protein